MTEHSNSPSSHEISMPGVGVLACGGQGASPSAVVDQPHDTYEMGNGHWEPLMVIDILTMHTFLQV